ncbi:MAG: universal stress protein [Dethiobacter sp.]|jgi:nucleotide-binding universal stress UspA family protein|nr:MAG: universal stress protein [Dethiobacter sp.]
MFKKVLVALDFSGPAMELFGSVSDLKKLGLEELLLVHTVRVELRVQDGISPLQLKFLEKIKEKKEELEKEGFHVEIEVPVGAPVEEIKRLAEQREMDLILIGSVGESSRVRELFLGSTVADLIRISPVPVLVEKYVSVGDKARRIPIFREKLATVLLPTDFSNSAEHAYDHILNIADKLQKVILLHVIDKGDTEEKVKEAETEAEARLKEWENKFAQKGIETRSLVIKGPPAQQIIFTAEAEGATLIAMSRRGRGRLSGLLIGSTADQVIRRGSRPVLLFGKKD